jgi:hypothetical protein
VIAFAYGGEPSNRPPDQVRRSYTQWEYFVARELNRPSYLLLADKTSPFDRSRGREAILEWTKNENTSIKQTTRLTARGIDDQRVRSEIAAAAACD